MIEITEEYLKRINQSILHIEENLSRDLSLNHVADIACFSPFHFHRIFKAITNETLNAFIKRRRVEKSAAVLMRNEATSVTEVATMFGFKSTSSFSRAFKQYYEISPLAFRKASPSKYSKIRQPDSKNGQLNPPFEPYICDMTNKIKWLEAHAKIDVFASPSIDLIRVNVIGLHRIKHAFEQLTKWASPKGLLESNEVKAVIIYHDSLKITAYDKARLSICFTIEEAVVPSGEISLTKIKSGRQIIARMEIGMEEFANAWESLLMWMNEKGHKKSQEDPFEVHHNNFNDHPEKKCIVDLCIPVEG